MIKRLPETHSEWRDYFSSLPPAIRRGGDQHGLEHARICQSINEIIDALNKTEKKWLAFLGSLPGHTLCGYCGHRKDSHSPDADQCWDFELEDPSRLRGYCSCPGFKEGLTNDTPPL